MGVPEKVVNIIIKLMEVWETKLELTDEGKLLTRKKIDFRKVLLQGDSFPLVEFCLTKVPVSMLMKETERYTLGKRNEERIAYLLTISPRVTKN